MSPEEITDAMIERLARYLYGDSYHWDTVGETPYTGWKNPYREKARHYLLIALGGESQ